MPGMMDTILNVGQNDAIVSSTLARTQNARFAYDTYRRFLATHATVALGLPKEPFERVLEDARARVATAKGLDQARLNAEELKRRVPDALIPAEELAAVAAEFKAIVREESGHAFPNDAHEQLWQAIATIFKSWNSPRAIAYRALRPGREPVYSLFPEYPDTAQHVSGALLTRGPDAGRGGRSQ